MVIYLKNQQDKLDQHLNSLKPKKVMDYESLKLKQKSTEVGLDVKLKIENLNLDFLFDYHIFPKNIMSFKTEWGQEDRTMKVGDTIVQQIFLPPTNIFSIKTIFGVRIIDIIDESGRKGFSYQTLEGHVERGISTFTVEQCEHKLIFKIHTYSIPANKLSRIVGPIFIIPYQTYCTKAALKYVKNLFEKQQ